MGSGDEQTAVKRSSYGQYTYPKQDHRRREQQREQHHFRNIGGGVGFVDSAREENKARTVVEIYRTPLKRGDTPGLHPFDTTKTKIETGPNTLLSPGWCLKQLKAALR